jgi:Prolyl oligopeptidase family
VLRYTPITIAAVAGTVCALPALAAEPDFIPTSCTAVARVGMSSRAPIHTDSVEARLIAGTFEQPHAGDTITRPNGTTATWETLKADKDGNFTGEPLNGGYAYVVVPSDSERVAILDASGHSMVYVNGIPRIGDPYSSGNTHLPIKLHKGSNSLLFLCGRGGLRVRVTAAPASAALESRDLTLPDLRVGEPLKSVGGVIVTNASESRTRGLALKISGEGIATRVVSVPPLAPLSTRKVVFPIVTSETPAILPDKEQNAKIRIELLGTKPSEATLVNTSLRIRPRTAPYRRTFTSQIDGSAQYFAVNPNRTPGVEDPRSKAQNALVLSLHGASVEAQGQSEAYNGKTWATIVCPTNRRPFGFDWEDWGQMDAMEVFGIAKRTIRTSPGQTYLTGHSMGGHGTWHIGVTYPGEFAAIGPSAGWISFFSYAGSARPENPSPTQKMLLRGTAPSDTIALEHNYKQEGVYIIHGDADDNVPVTEARTMFSRLGEFHHDFDMHEQPGAGHWWGNSDEPGAACVDWPALFDFFGRHQVPSDAQIRDIEFVTANPGISAHDHWVTIEQQLHSLVNSSVKLRVDPGKRRFAGTTSNVRTLTLSLSPLSGAEPFMVDLDGTKIEDIPWQKSGTVTLKFSEESKKWVVSELPAPTEKSPLRSGPFKQGMQHRMLFVYGTHGTPEENSWALQKARYDAETFWYRGNGSIDVIPDTEFNPKKEIDRSVVLYGTLDGNSAAPALLSSSPIQVGKSAITIKGGKSYSGDDLACLFLRPRPGSASASVVVVTGTGLKGLRLTERMPYFVSGADFPDLLVVGSDSLLKGAEGVRAAGYFGYDWSVEKGDFQWN